MTSTSAPTPIPTPTPTAGRPAAATAALVAVAVGNGATDFELGTAYEVFGVDRHWLTPDWYRFRLCAAHAGPVRTEMGLRLEPDYGLEGLADADIVVVPAAARSERLEPLYAALRAAHARGARIISLCTGAFLLAEAGLLDGRRATTHWAYAAELAARHPEVRVDPDVLYVEDGGIFSSAGTAAGIDLCLQIVRRDFGPEIANTVARRMVVAPHRDGGQAQFVDVPMPACAEENLAPLLDWALERLADPLTLESLARRANVSSRTLVRRFAATTGTTPLQWLLTQRVRRAQHLLESTDAPVERVAELSGLGTPANLRQHFARLVGVSPTSYRRTFRGGDSAADARAAS